MRPTGCRCNAACVPLQCLIVDDSAPFLAAAVGLLEREGVTVVGVASDSADALQKAHKLCPDVILVDIALGSESGLDLAQHLAEMGSNAVGVILISTHPEADFADLIEELPVTGFLAKSDLSATAVQQLIRGGL